MLHPKFLEKMKQLLHEEMDDYLATLKWPVFRGFTVNPLKSKGELFAIHQYHQSAFCREGYVLDEEISIGKTLDFKMGCIYSQEPSAGCVVEVLDPQPGDLVLDLCAAPGGKSSQIAYRLHHQGTLFSNEIDFKRAKVLLSNLERLGVDNAVITSMSPEQLCPQLAECMDKIVVDAPCSGEGMFKKEDEAIQGWSQEHVEACAHRQSKILDSAYLALRQGGILVYSTCTYAIEENEKNIEAFLKRHPDMKIVPIDVSWGRPGIPTTVDTQYARRIFPMDQGEGHFVCKMVKESGGRRTLKKSSPQSNPLVQAFLKEQIHRKLQIQIHHEKVYVSDCGFYDLKGILRQGVECGEIIKGRFEPHHHFYVSYQDDLLKKVECSQAEVKKVYRGETIEREIKGFVALTYHGISFGFGKGDGRIIKNKIPKGIRGEVECD